jgi:uncharacterized membrane protein
MTEIVIACTTLKCALMPLVLMGILLALGISANLNTDKHADANTVINLVLVGLTLVFGWLTWGY